MKAVRRGAMAVAAIAAVSLPAYFNSQQGQQYLQTAALTLTLVVVVWYTWETSRMQQSVAHQVELANRQAAEMARQIKVSIMPTFIVDFGHDAEGKQAVLIRNAGNGVALNVTMDEVEAPLIEGGVIKVGFGRIPLLQHDRVAVELSHYFDGYAVPPSADESFDSGKTFELLRYGYGESHPLRVKFQDLEGTRYVQTIRIIRDRWGLGACDSGPVEVLTPEVEERARRESAAAADEEQRLLDAIRAEFDSVDRNTRETRQFFELTVRPAFDELKEQLEGRGRVVKIWGSKDAAGVTMQVFRNNAEEFRYNMFARVTPDEIRVIVITHEGDWRVNRAEVEDVITIDPGTGTALAAITRAGITKDFLRRYKPEET